MLAEGEDELAAALDRAPAALRRALRGQLQLPVQDVPLRMRAPAACRMARLARAAGPHRARRRLRRSPTSPRPTSRRGVHYALLGEADHTLRELLDVLTGRSARRVDAMAGPRLPGGAGATTACGGRPRASPSASPTSSPSRPGTSSTRALPRGLAAGARLLHDEHGHHARLPVPLQLVREADLGPALRHALAGQRRRGDGLVKRTFAPDHIWFADDIFGLQPRWVAEFADEVEARDAAMPFTIQSRADLMTEPRRRRPRPRRLREVWLGAESGSQKILDAMDKGTRVEQIATPPARLQAGRHPRRLLPPVRLPRRDLRRHRAHPAAGARLLPDDIGVASPTRCPAPASSPWCRPSSGSKDNWQDSDDLAMLFQGPFRRPSTAGCTSCSIASSTLRRRGDCQGRAGRAGRR